MPPAKAKRNPRACDRCKLKKIKCDGTSPCHACAHSDAVCYYSARHGRFSADKRGSSSQYIDQLKDQQSVLVEALRRAWKRCEGDDKGEQSVHYIISQLGLLNDSSHGHIMDAAFGEDLPASGDESSPMEGEQNEDAEQMSLSQDDIQHDLDGEWQPQSNGAPQSSQQDPLHNPDANHNAWDDGIDASSFFDAGAAFDSFVNAAAAYPQSNASTEPTQSELTSLFFTSQQDGFAAGYTSPYTQQNNQGFDSGLISMPTMSVGPMPT